MFYAAAIYNIGNNIHSKLIADNTLIKPEPPHILDSSIPALELQMAAGVIFHDQIQILIEFF